MRNPFAPQWDEHKWDRLAFALATVIGAAVIVTADGDEMVRKWIVSLSFIAAATFVLIYRRLTWQRTYAGRATMFAMRVTALYTGHTALILWWEYPHWQVGQSLVYLAILLSVLYKLRALTRREAHRDPST